PRPPPPAGQAGKPLRARPPASSISLSSSLAVASSRGWHLSVDDAMGEGARGVLRGRLQCEISSRHLLSCVRGARTWDARTAGKLDVRTANNRAWTTVLGVAAICQARRYSVLSRTTYRAG